MTPSRTFVTFVFAFASLPLVAAACSDAATSSSTPPAPPAVASPPARAPEPPPAPPSSDAGDAGDAGEAGDAGDAASASLSAITSFDASKFELAEGLVVKDGKAYVGLAPLGEIRAIAPDGSSATYAHVPAGGTHGYTLGLAFDAAGALFVGETKNDADPAAPAPGIYRIPAGGGDATTPFASDAAMTFPNGLAFDGAGNLLVADSGSGVVFRVAPNGAVTTWKSDPELEGSPACPAPLPFPIGANGIVWTKDTVYVANTAKGSILAIAVDAAGDAGAVTTLVKDCTWVGWDGLALDTDGTLLAAQNGTHGRLARITTKGDVTVLSDADPLLDSPASVAIATWSGQKTALVTTSAFFSVGVDGGAPKPGLLRFAPLP